MSRLASLVKRLSVSCFLLTLVFLAAFDLALGAVRPFRFVNVSSFIPLDQNPMVTKLKSYLSSGDNPDIVILGSSMMLVPSARCDDEFTGKRARHDHWYRRHYINQYMHAKLLEHELEKRTGKRPHVVNLAITGAMLADQSLILEKLLAAGKRPRLLICEVAPRSFQDNLFNQIERSPVFQVLADFQSIGELSQRGLTGEQLRDFTLGSVWHYYKVKADYRTFVSNLLAAAIGHPVVSGTEAPEFENPLNPEAEWEADYSPRRNTLSDMSTAKSQYNPPDPHLVERQSWYFDKMLSTAAAAGIPVVMVNMPLTPENKSLMRAELLEAYYHRIAEICANHGATLLDAESADDYELADFEDSCHLAAGGGRKLFSAIASRISGDGKLLAALSRPHGTGGAELGAVGRLLGLRDTTPDGGANR